MPFARLVVHTCSFSTGCGLACLPEGAVAMDRSAAAPATPARHRARAANPASVEVTVTRPIAVFWRTTWAPARVNVRDSAPAVTPLSASTWKVRACVGAATAPTPPTVAPTALPAIARAPVTASILSRRMSTPPLRAGPRRPAPTAPHAAPPYVKH